jgi:hypothetical protein
VTKHEVASVLVLKKVCPSLLCDTLVDRYNKIIGLFDERKFPQSEKYVVCHADRKGSKRTARFMLLRSPCYYQIYMFFRRFTAEKASFSNFQG